MDNNKLAKSGFDTREIPYVGQNPFYNDEHKKVCLDCDIEKIMNDDTIMKHDNAMRIPTINPYELSDESKAFNYSKSKMVMLSKVKVDEVESIYGALEKYKADTFPNCPDYKDLSICKKDTWTSVIYRGIKGSQAFNDAISKAHNYEVLFYKENHVASFIYDDVDLKQYVFMSDEYEKYITYYASANALAHGYISEDLVKILYRYKEIVTENVVAQMHPVVQPDKTLLTKDKMIETEENEDDIETLTEEAKIDDDIKDTVDSLNKKGYKTKYSCSGHNHTRIKDDNYRDGIYKGNLYTTARIVFNTLYELPDAPEYWNIKQVDGKSYMNVKPLPYNTKDGTPEQAFIKWKDLYMASLKEWVKKLDNKKDAKNESEKNLDNMNKKVPKDKTTNEIVDESVEVFIDDLFFDLM